MSDTNVNELLVRIAEQQQELLSELQAQRKTGKDFWDRLTAVGPIFSAVIIACTGAYFTYSYNQQQLKVQEIQTVERFIPHLIGDEKTKRAAILAISSMGNTQLAAKVASIFASEGTASALKSIAQSSEQKDRQLIQDALYKTLDILAQKYKAEGSNVSEAPVEKDSVTPVVDKSRTGEHVKTAEVRTETNVQAIDSEEQELQPPRQALSESTNHTKL